jgi:hypothetical protein
MMWNITREAKMSLNGKTVYVYLLKGGEVKVCLPGDLMEITDKLTPLELKKAKDKVHSQKAKEVAHY